MQTEILIFLAALTLAGVHALRGSGFFSYHLGTSQPIKWGLIPVLMCFAAGYFGANWWQALLFLAPYAFLMGTGTGGLMQASVDNKTPETFNPHEMRPFDNIANFVANFMVYDFRVFSFKTYDMPSDGKAAPAWHQVWGVTYCVLVALVFSVPFIFTNYYLATFLLLYPAVVRYCRWRFAEFWLMFFYAENFLSSLVAA